jgi:PIN domain nuclease of toxin-antitoxin system
MRPEAVSRINDAARHGNLILPAVSVFEVALLASRNRLTIAGDFDPWIDRMLRREGLRVEAMTAAIALDAAKLLYPAPRDPSDRMIIATARAHGAPVVTRDRAIIAYGRAGHVEVLPC